MSATNNLRSAGSPTDVLEHIRPGTDLIVPSDNGEPVTVLDAIEAAAGRLERVTVHQALAVHDRPSHAGAFGDRLRHISYFLTPKLREHYERGTIDLMPNDLSRIPAILRARTTDPLLLVSVSPPDCHGYVSLGTNAMYGAALIGEVRVFAEVNRRMPRTSGRNQLRLSHVVGWVEADYPLWSPPPVPITDTDRAIAAFVAERIPDGATLQIGIGAVPDAVAGLLADHCDLGIHTEFLADGIRRLIEGGAATGALKRRERFQAVTTDSFGSPDIYPFLDENRHVQFCMAAIMSPFPGRSSRSAGSGGHARVRLGVSHVRRWREPARGWAPMAGSDLPAFHGIIGRSAPMQALFAEIEAFARVDVPILIRGESATGKELVAKAIQRQASLAAW